MAKSTSSTPFSASDSMEDLVYLDENEANEFSLWELINQSDADSDTDSLHSVENGFLSWYSLTAPPPPRSASSDDEIETETVIEGRFVVDAANFVGMPVENDENCHNEEEDEEEGMDDDDDVGYGVDDELVAWNLAGKFGGRQRMRKLGKRFCSKMGNTKRDRYAYVKRGCVHGKHELEMKA